MSISNNQRLGTIRSATAMRGLLEAEIGDSMVQFILGNEGSHFVTGSRIMTEVITSGGNLKFKCQKPVRPLSRHGTLVTEGGSLSRTAAELQRLLGNSHSRLQPGSALLPPLGNPLTVDVKLEQAKLRTRMNVDIHLETNVFVQGDDVHGQVIVHVQKPSKKDTPVLVSNGKFRILGFECMTGSNVYYTFYHCSTLIDGSPLFSSEQDKDGFAQASEGLFKLPFIMNLPVSDDNGVPRGAIPDLLGATVRYAAIVSFKLKDAVSGKYSVAHFYRTCEVWPRLNLQAVLAPAPRLLRANISKSLAMGGSGKLEFTASLRRLSWISGQRCFVHLSIQNATKRRITCLTLTLLRSTVVFRPHLDLDVSHPRNSYGIFSRDPDACQTTTTVKTVVESKLEAGDQAARGHASSKGWWIGIGPGEHMNVTHSILIPPDEVSITRGGLLEVGYSLQVTLSAGTLLPASAQVALPIRLISFLSLDPQVAAFDPAVAFEKTVESTTNKGRIANTQDNSRAPYFEPRENTEYPMVPGEYENGWSNDIKCSSMQMHDSKGKNDNDLSDPWLLKSLTRSDEENRSRPSVKFSEGHGERLPVLNNKSFTASIKMAGNKLLPEIPGKNTAETANDIEYTPVLDSSCTNMPKINPQEGEEPMVSSFALRVENKLHVARLNKVITSPPTRPANVHSLTQTPNKKAPLPRSRDPTMLIGETASNGVSPGTTPGRSDTAVRGKSCKGEDKYK
ncbi:hypothetical protein AMATHDRAFT_4691 [Amanita thiersii Skay4041]|uniref:Arrestin C-terminal-like domain-containing protein n=1 Tax=Amanita thiersii Skay4041 TaxID=703135 RepID=A0A2A9NF98_9AGAR|nr:hypothetical protein AMATHDRAFT_4691 [Amanita thiersii Skay4041]